MYLFNYALKVYGFDSLYRTALRCMRENALNGPLCLVFERFDMLLASISTDVRCAATFLYAMGDYSVSIAIMGWVRATLWQKPEKKAAAFGLLQL
jgi:hypothetical protein